MKVKEEFKIGKNNIGYISSDFINEFGDQDLEEGKVLPFQKLTRSMNDYEIIKELKVNECTLGDVLATLQSPGDELKDGNWNLFYTPSHVVGVRWLGSYWYVFGWSRDDGRWFSVRRVFSPATSGAETLKSGPSETLTLKNVCECERCEKCGKLLV